MDAAVAPAQVLVTTDVLFKQLGADNPPPKLDLLIDFDLPLQKVGLAFHLAAERSTGTALDLARKR